jgi:spore coat polysaccharide biosynthesis protein SpsF
MKCAILITARLKSTRLPMKVTKHIHGKPMIKHMLDRLKLSKAASEIIICTSTVAQDDPLEDLARREGVLCFRGDADDVLLRLASAAEKFGVETVINCTADNPFVDPIYIDKLYQHHVGETNEFSKIEGLPWGVFSYAISYSALRKACDLKDETDTEVWHGYFMNTGSFKWNALQVIDQNVYWPELRLTVDVPEDFEMVTRVFDELYDGQRVFPLTEIVQLCRSNPKIPAMNSDVMQKAGIPIKIKDASSDD